MTFAPYTKDAITRIKNGATPSDLGWDESFYLRVCKNHGLEPNVHGAKTHAIAEIAAAAVPPLAPPISCTQAQQPLKSKPAVETTDADPTACILNLATRTVRRDGFFAYLAKQQTEVLRLINRGTIETPMSGKLIAQRLGLDPKTGNVAGAIRRIREKIEPLGIKIVTAVAYDSGYHITDAKSGEHIKLRVAGVSKP